MVMQDKQREVRHVLIAAGGTGGHVYPALAVAEYFREMNVNITWVGTEKGLEHRVVPAAGISLELISISGLRGKGIFNMLYVPVKLLRAVFQAVRIFYKVKPDVVLGLGGFVSGPCGLAAYLLRKPLFIHEQNAVPGLTNKVLSYFATNVMEAFPGSFKNSKKVISVGNPVRKDITGIAEPKARLIGRNKKIRLLIIGGSLGAQALNESIPKVISELDENLIPDVWHQAGKNKLDGTLKNYKKYHVEATVTEFIDDMAEAYSWADLVICRSGALTISELANVGLAAILVPYPYAVDDHQTENAMYLCNTGAACLVQQDQLSSKLKEILSEILQAGRTRLLKMANSARELAKPDATQLVAETCLGVAHG